MYHPMQCVLTWEEYERLLHFFTSQADREPATVFMLQLLEETSQYEEETEQVYLILQEREATALIKCLIQGLPAKERKD